MNRSALRIACSALVFAVLFATTSPGDEPTAPRRVLFVGNSLTYFNDLPRMVEAISRRGGDSPAIRTETIAFANAALEDHWHGKEALARIDRGGFHDVVLQQGPSSLPDSRSRLVAWTKRFAERIRAAGGRPALYMVWPAADRAADAPRVAASYAAAARAADGPLLPAGEAWRAAWKRDGSLQLYGPDRFHPSPLGSYLAAIVIESVLTGRPPWGEATRLETASGALVVENDRARLLAAAAADAIAAR